MILSRESTIIDYQGPFDQALRASIWKIVEIFEKKSKNLYKGSYVG